MLKKILMALIIGIIITLLIWAITYIIMLMKSLIAVFSIDWILGQSL